ncbi:extracellular solute-binding protein [Actinokineospora iranica]|uniref:Multiple sugar transport system substrate-binding protein n=1 Tax=Actinokineospora iranica TaxID=1271860 RepID=A0A1G6U2V5_9PSEU|nr:extracellular solute-binding protein [Actinokineospora iranica]SDD35621.1 multiple sugar transport system substrate-binding protein [Actinokineospora iranica]
MPDSGGRWSPRYRVFVVTLVLVVVIAITSTSVLLTSLLLAAETDHRWSAGSVLRLLAVGVVVILSGVSVNFLPKAIRTVWHNPERANIGFVDLAGRLGRALRRPLKQVGIGLTVVAIVAAGVAFRPASTGLEPGPLVLMTGFSESASDPRSMLVNQWNQLNPDNPVVFNVSPGEPDQQNARMVNDAKPDGEHEADVYVLDVVWMAQFADRGYIRPLDQARLSAQDTGDFVPKVLDTCKRGGTLWALPFNTDVGLLFHRTDIPGVVSPKTWDDYYGSAAKAAAARTPGVAAANAAQLANEEVLTVTAFEAIWAAGGEVVDKTGQVLHNPDKSEVYFGQADLKGIANLAAASRDPDIVLTEDDEARKTAETAASDAFREGRTLYMRNWPVAVDRVGESVPFGVAVPPSPSVLGGQNLAISASTDKPRAAQALIEFLTSAQSQLLLSEIGGFAPTRQSAFSNAKRPDRQAVRTALDGARLRPVTRNYPEFSRVFRQGILRALNDNGKLEDGFAEELAAILRRP